MAKQRAECVVYTGRELRGELPAEKREREVPQLLAPYFCAEPSRDTDPQRKSCSPHTRVFVVRDASRVTFGKTCGTRITDSYAPDVEYDRAGWVPPDDLWGAK